MVESQISNETGDLKIVRVAENTGQVGFEVFAAVIMSVSCLVEVYHRW